MLQRCLSTLSNSSWKSLPPSTPPASTSSTPIRSGKKVWRSIFRKCSPRTSSVETGSMQKWWASSLKWLQTCSDHVSWWQRSTGLKNWDPEWKLTRKPSKLFCRRLFPNKERSIMWHTEMLGTTIFSTGIYNKFIINFTKFTSRILQDYIFWIH